MVKRSYEQHCGLAAALDVVGERWAMLVIRDLDAGPRRFTDLSAGLPGLATDVLTDRLRTLEAAGAVEQRTLKHPVPAKVYALTERGRDLARIGSELAKWGMPLLPTPRDTTYRTNPRWALQMMAHTYQEGLPVGEYRWTIDDEELRVDVGTSTAAVGYGHGAGDPVLSVRCSSLAFFSLVLQRGARSRRSGTVILDGDAELLEAFFAAMPIQVGAAT